MCVCLCVRVYTHSFSSQRADCTIAGALGVGGAVPRLQLTHPDSLDLHRVMSSPLSHPLGSHQRLYLTPAPEAGCQQAEPLPPTVHGVLMTPARPQGQADPGPPPAQSACSAAEPLGSHPGNDISSTTADERPRHKGLGLGPQCCRLRRPGCW